MMVQTGWTAAHRGAPGMCIGQIRSASRSLTMDATWTTWRSRLQLGHFARVRHGPTGTGTPDS